VNEQFARAFFADQDAIGHRIAVTVPPAATTPPERYTIVGVAPDVRQSPSGDPQPIAFRPLRSAPPASAVLMVRNRADTGSVASQLRHAVMTLDPTLPLYQMRTMAQAIRDAQWNGRLAERIFFLITLIAAALSTVGLYAVTAHGVSQRSQEIGVRMALGAQPSQVVRMILRGVLVQLAVGFALGVAGTLLWDWAFSSGRPNVRVTDPETLIMVAAMLGTLAAIACAVPARRATHLDPVAAIRHE
jgi:putative ABC transport system permease protein